ncbi:MAG: outer membrane beta-barrel protein [Siculibacillus sp.]|nr:outer membrane beta-barrel protein [Siculibacillus sp.]
MTRIATHLLAGMAFLGLAGTAHAADVGGPFRAPSVIQPIAEVGSSGGWYLRGDVGIGINATPKFSSTGTAGIDANPTAAWLARDIADTPFIGVGVGYQFTDYLRGDITAEYRSATRYRANASYPRGVGDIAYPYYDGDLRSTVIMANAYADLGNYSGLTPFVGVGLGMAYNKTGDTYQHTSFPAFGTFADGVLPGSSKWNVAWALHTGVTWDVNSRLKLEMGYSYKNLGQVGTRELRCNEAGGVVTNCNEWLKLKNLATNDLRIGMRWLLNPVEPRPMAYPAPVVAKY